MLFIYYTICFVFSFPEKSHRSHTVHKPGRKSPQGGEAEVWVVQKSPQGKETMDHVQQWQHLQSAAGHEHGGNRHVCPPPCPPQLEKKLTTEIEAWEREQGREFLVSGQKFMQYVEEQWEAHRMDKENEKQERVNNYSTLSMGRVFK